MGLQDTAFITDIAANYDVVINPGSGFVVEGATAFVHGLARRVQPGSGSPPPWLLHIAGCTNLGDRPLTENSYPNRELDDSHGRAVYDFLCKEKERHPYPQRTTELGVLTAAKETGVQAISLNASCIFGRGTGLFRKHGLIIPALTRYVAHQGYGFKLTETCTWDSVHVEGLADAYVLLLRTILEREDRGVGYLPSGDAGILFPAVQRFRLTEMMERCLDVTFNAAVLPRHDTPPEKEIRQAELKAIADELTGGLLDMAEQGWAGHKAQKGTMLRQLVGWNPTRLEDALRKDFVDELNALKGGERGQITMDSCIGAK